MNMNELPTVHCDVLVVGSGAGGLSTAITAKKNGLDVLVVEKEPVFGGTTAFSGGVLWIPLSPHAKKAGHADSRAHLRRTDHVREETRPRRWWSSSSARPR